MSAKINGVTSNQPAAPATGSAGQRAAAAASATASSTSNSASDSVQITDTASYLVNAEQALSDVPVMNQGRLSEISDSLAAGTYKISAERVANQLLQFEWLLPEDQFE